MSKKIYIQDWLLLKPYQKQTATDNYYLRLSNDVKDTLMWDEQFFTQRNMDENDINKLACFLTSYFEDIISGTNIWNAFVRKHKQLYKKHLPFFAPKDYFEEEINVEDIHFLMWYFINSLQENTIIFPYHPQFRIISDRVMDIFEDAWEYAPENEHLQSFYQIDANESDFYFVRKLIDRVLFDTYLFHIDTGIKLKEKEKEILENAKNDEDRTIMYLNDNRDNILHNSHTQLLALTGKEWAAEILGSAHPLYNELLSISRKINGWFYYKGQDKTDVFLEHIASGMKFNMTKKSYERFKDLQNTDDLLYIGIVKWKNEWWFSGIQARVPFNADLILDEKNSLSSRNAVAFLYHQSDNVQEMLDEQLTSFLKFNKGSQIAFMPASEVDNFLKKYTEFYNNSLNLSEKEIKESEERLRKDGFFHKDKPIFSDFEETQDTALVFFNPKSGAEILLDTNSAFPLPNNPYFKKRQSEEHIIRLLMDVSISPEAVWFCIDNCKSKLPFFKQGIGKELLKDMDFMLRYWKGRNYFQDPSITLTGIDD